MKLKFKLVNKNLKTKVPKYQSKDSSGMDLCSASKEKIIIPPFRSRLIPTNLILEIPKGYEGQVRPRSGLALKHNVTVLNSPGTIDSDYRGEVKVLLYNLGMKNFTVKFGDRIAQLIISKYEKVTLKQTNTLSKTKRGKGGYGSTGV